MKVYFFFRRILDTLVSLFFLILLSPGLLLIGLAVKLDTKGPAVFKQMRIGKNGKPYRMYKFRTMVTDAQNMGTGVYSFAGDSRITKVGRFLRKTSLDELLQLWNVVKGDMAIVGPRSPVVNHFPDYETLNDDYKRRFSVLPGITGLAQVVGRNDFSWDEKTKYDNIYIDKIQKFGPLYDIKIIFLTVKRVFSMSDVSEKPENQAINSESFGLNETAEAEQETEKESAVK